MTVHNFEKDLAYSVQASAEDFWDGIYRKAFPNLVNHMLCEGNTASQRMGIDRFIMLASGKTLAIDEKKRRYDCGDILLEYISNNKTNAPGWIEKDLAIDYLAYAFPKSKRCYLFPWQELRRAWKQWGKQWFEYADDPLRTGYKLITADNLTYKTLCIVIPLKHLISAVAYASRIDI